MALSGREVDTAEIDYDRAEQMYLAAIRKREDHTVLAERADEAERLAGVWATALTTYAEEKRRQGIPADETAQEAQVVENFLRNLWGELAEAHRLPLDGA